MVESIRCGECVKTTGVVFAARSHSNFNDAAWNHAGSLTLQPKICRSVASRLIFTTALCCGVKRWSDRPPINPDTAWSLRGLTCQPGQQQRQRQRPIYFPSWWYSHTSTTPPSMQRCIPALTRWMIARTFAPHPSCITRSGDPFAMLWIDSLGMWPARQYVVHFALFYTVSLVQKLSPPCLASWWLWKRTWHQEILRISCSCLYQCEKDTFLNENKDRTISLPTITCKIIYCIDTKVLITTQ